MKKTILDLKIGEVGIVKQFSDFEATCKLLTMGLIPNARVILVRKSPFGGALYIQLEDHMLGMRNMEAASVEIEIV